MFDFFTLEWGCDQGWTWWVGRSLRGGEDGPRVSKVQALKSLLWKLIKMNFKYEKRWAFYLEQQLEMALKRWRMALEMWKWGSFEWERKKILGIPLVWVSAMERMGGRKDFLWFGEGKWKFGICIWHPLAFYRQTLEDLIARAFGGNLQIFLGSLRSILLSLMDLKINLYLDEHMSFSCVSMTCTIFLIKLYNF